MVSTRGTRSKQPNADQPPPNAEEWVTMTPYGCLRAADQGGGEIVFSVGDTASVMPGRTKSEVRAPRAPSNLWLVRILAIRGRQRSSGAGVEVWARINWYYSRQEVSHKIKGFNSSHCSEYERIYSDHSEIISALVLDAVVPVSKFREDDATQAPVGAEEFFCRYFLQTSSHPCQMWSYASSPSTHQEEFLGCICGSTYDLNDADPLRVMHMCPRPHCRRFHHSSCLLECGHWCAASDPATRPATFPEGPFVSEYFTCKHLSPSPNVLHTRIPSSLLAIASQPIVRGAALHNQGITGNSRDVLYARDIVSSALGGVAPPDTWEDAVDANASVVDCHLPRIQLEGTGEGLVLTCPDCSFPI
ncbi:hypothetical protein C8R47DRAFT_1317141 [Mycena vitilis]|nr:hypothetical protein C8R47DRAFT_1317141 [Mycena vitilis]